MKKKRKEIAVLATTGWGEQARLIEGVMRYVRAVGTWHITPIPESNVSLSFLRGWKGDGIIGGFKTRDDLATLSSFRAAAVNLSGKLPPGLLPRVMTDNAAVGRLAAEHLLERYFKRFAVIARRGTYDDSERRRGFLECLADNGADADSFLVPSLFSSWRTWSHVDDKICGFLRELTTPVGIFVCDDVRANMVLNACRRLRLQVPEEVAVIGVDNNTRVCEVSLPSLSSVARPFFETGYEAARLLDRLMGGEELPAADHLLPPGEVVQRRSTEVVAVDDPHVRTIVNHIRDHISEPFGAMEMVEKVPRSRRWLERRFKSEVGCSIYDYIIRERLRRAERLLLTQPALSIKDIAGASGFSSVKRLRIVFRRPSGLSPTAFREQG